MTLIESTTAISRDLVRVRGRSIGAREEVVGTTCRKNSDFWRNYTLSFSSALAMKNALSALLIVKPLRWGINARFVTLYL